MTFKEFLIHAKYQLRTHWKLAIAVVATAIVFGVIAAVPPFNLIAAATAAAYVLGGCLAWNVIAWCGAKMDFKFWSGISLFRMITTAGGCIAAAALGLFPIAWPLEIFAAATIAGVLVLYGALDLTIKLNKFFAEGLAQHYHTELFNCREQEQTQQQSLIPSKPSNQENPSCWARMCATLTPSCCKKPPAEDTGHHSSLFSKKSSHESEIRPPLSQQPSCTG